MYITPNESIREGKVTVLAEESVRYHSILRNNQWCDDWSGI